METTNRNIPALRFPEFKGEWSFSKMSNIATKITDGTHDTPKPTQEGVPYITAIHVKDGFIDFGNCYYVSKEIHEIIYKRCNPQKDDLLIVNIGAGTATCSIIDVSFPFSLKNVALVKPDKTKIYPLFLSHFQRKQSKILFNRLTSGGAQPFLSLKEIGKIDVCIPPIPEQQKIASFLTAVDNKIQQLQRKKTLLEQYKKGIMQQIFTRQLRFKDDEGRDFPEWEEKTLGKVCSIDKGKQLNVEHLTENGKYYALNGGIEPSGFTDEWNREENTITISEGGNSCGYVNYNYENFWCGGHCYSLSIADNEINDKYLFHYLKFKQAYIMRLRVGSGLPNIQKKSLSDFRIEHPKYKEQKKIASFIDSIDKKIRTIQKDIEQTQNFKKGLLQQMFV